MWFPSLMRILRGIFRHCENDKSLKTVSFVYSRILSGAPTYAGIGMLLFVLSLGVGRPS